jgi:RNA polymerase sigma-70 factor (ECF subfamily)
LNPNTKSLPGGAIPSGSISSTFEEYRYLLFSIAYRMLGSAMDAEDIVQEAYLRYQAASHQHIDSPKALLTTVVTRLCLDHLKSAKVQRETYVGPWLPEPVLTGGGSALVSAPAEFSHHESISMAFLVLLESLTPVERAVFLLREVFDYDYAEIARIVNRQEAACRQLFSRARKHITDHQPRFKAAPEVHNRLVNTFMQAIEVGDLEGLTQMLAEEVSWWSDGGGKVKGITQPVYGRDAVIKLLNVFIRRRPSSFTMEITEFNGETALILRMDGQFYGVAFIEIHDQQITSVRAVINPDKLAHLMT